VKTRLDPTREFIALNIAILTVSDTRSLEEDSSGALLVQRLQAAGHCLADRQIVRDEIDAIRSIITKWTQDGGAQDKAVHVIITTGGTGFTGRDVTPEAVEPLMSKRMDGFSTLFHLLSYQTIGTVTIQSRCLAGMINARLVFCLPGSKGACQDAWDGILAGQLDSRQLPSNFVELMPRFKE